MGFQVTIRLCTIWSIFLIFMMVLNLQVELPGVLCFWSFCILSLLFAFLFLVEVIFRRKQKIDAVDGALFFEEHFARDGSLVCAAEIVEKQKVGVKSNPVELSLLAHIESQAASLKLTPLLFSRRFFPLKAWLLLCFLSLSFTGFRHSSYWDKGEFYLNYRFLGGDSGLEVTPKNFEVEFGQDVNVVAKISKGKDQAHLIYKQGAVKQQKLEMFKQNDSHVMTIFNIQQPVQYMVVTPLVRSELYTITPYLAPQIDDFSVKVTPPPYTGIKPSIYKKLTDIRLPKGSSCVIDVVTNKNVAVGMTFGEVRRRSDRFATNHQFPITVGQDVEVSLSGTDRAGRAWKPKKFMFQVSEDLPPVITVFDPALDSRAIVNDDVYVNLGVVDEYGVSDVKLNWFIGQGKVNSIPLFPKAGEMSNKEVNLSHALDLELLKAKPGDFVCFYISATDNCQPKANRAESRLYFVEVRPKDKDEKKDDKKDQDKKGEKQEELKIDDLMAELKRLIRRSWEWRHPDSRTSAEVNKLSQRMSDLRIISRKRLNELLEKAGIPKGQGGKIEALFESAISEMQRAETLLQKELVDESQGAQRGALADFIKIALELEKNSKKQKGKGESKDPKQGKKKQDSKEKTKKQTRRQKMDKMKNAMKQLEQLMDDQAALQEKLQNAQNKDTASNQSHRLNQQQMAAQSKKLADKVRNLEGSEEAQETLQQAIDEMGRNVEQLMENEPKKGARHAMRAHRHLNATHKLLRQKYSKESGDMLDELKQIAMALASGQHKIQQETEASAKQKPSDADADKLLDRQQQWNNHYKSLEQAINSTADELDEKHRPISEALQQLLEKAVENKLQTQMKRAEKSLLYRRFDRAEKAQENVVQQFQQMAIKLDELSELMPRVDQEELLKALAKINQAKARMQQLKGLQNGQQKGKLKKALKQQMTNQLDELGNKIKSTRMRRLAEIMESMQVPGEGNAGIDQLMEILNSASRTVERQLVTDKIKKIVDDQRMFSTPPREYEKLVEEYFKSLTD